MSETYVIKGAYFRPPAQAILSLLPANIGLFTQPEPENEADPNAIAVYLKVPEAVKHVGDNDVIMALFTEALSGAGYSWNDFITWPQLHLGYIPRGSASPVLQASRENHDGFLTFSLSGAPLITIY